ncbi:hypothetical protein N5J23_04725 [Comamonas aquatica]|uniref:Uncharacterized protein n=1 Tax=Comamonas aquatica TaxID=225991 RepID=A0AA43AVZ8_9BURK|nr:hypothetical protein [Comamonas aquatica]MDH1429091.1 hypothetical protein [Comamonas aquatica]MDH1604968.1 hypothetical protein [Comamonas aquatica]MDH1615992.1 hypothetical protein [Comamonas aquatica]MDH2004857.1 hypothetical protein [Comamonas aquatica]
MTLQPWLPAQDSPEIPVNENFDALSHMAVYAKDATTTTGLTWGYLGGRWGGFAVTAGTLTLPASSTLYVTVSRATGAISASASDAAWQAIEQHARVYKLVTGAATVTSIEDYRAGFGGVHGIVNVSSAGGGGITAIPIACSDETTALTTGVAKVTFRMPYAMALTAVRASLTTAQTSGGLLTLDINADGASILSTKLTVDNNEKSSKSAATPPVISDALLVDDAEITIDIDQVGDSTAKGLKVYLIGVAE